ncbi:hypothetical protein RND71_043555 [Anisodus tanguticus]|uniref:Prenyltransferase alpha-alpha toroid domain-containing protein n=1 Tax=Anisodus tanguticus TaxID=243964 RepID=A0AAE1QN97_9SOLA|nr:hypothetical protein RND71_043555 [Anisodus tanguticus]
MDEKLFLSTLVENYKEDDNPTDTSVQQIEVENSLRSVFKKMKDKYHKNLDELLFLFRGSHVNFLTSSLHKLSRHYEYFDSSRPWIVYWISQSISVLGHEAILKKNAMHIANYLKTCENQETGGYAGFPGGIAHLATTYAAVNAIVTLKSTEALDTIDRDKLHNFISLMKCKNGSFRMHLDGEKDVRGAYCAVSVASICNFLDDESLFDKTPEWIATCQTYEGGFGPCPNNEAHGGYTFCSVAALCLLKKSNLIKFDPLMRWLVKKQMKFEGGFCGRTNKLVDLLKFFQLANGNYQGRMKNKGCVQNSHLIFRSSNENI